MTYGNLRADAVITSTQTILFDNLLVSGQIDNADISATAEIAVSKLADGAARQLLQTDAAGTGVEWTDNIDIPGTLDVTGVATFDNSSTFNGAFVFNELGGNVDLRMEGDTDTNLFFLDASVDRIGIGQAAPATKFDLNGSYSANITAVPVLDIDCSSGNFFTKTISTSSSFTFSNAPASRAYSFTLEVNHTSGTITWPASVTWPTGTTPTLTTGKTHLFIFVTDDGGTKWRGASLVDYTT